jgi:hypothetical protein
VSDQAQLPGELLYEYTSKFTQVVEYGVSMEALLSGQTPPPPEGARFDVYFEGPITGAKLSGSVKGVDYLHLRADGRFQLRIHAEITAEASSSPARPIAAPPPPRSRPRRNLDEYPTRPLSPHTSITSPPQNQENKWANDTDGFALKAQPDKSQGRPLKSTGSKPIAQTGLPNMRSPKAPVPVTRA